MKQSHYTTPRTMVDGVWVSGADPWEPHNPNRAGDVAVKWALFVGVLAVLAALLWS